MGLIWSILSNFGGYILAGLGALAGWLVLSSRLKGQGWAQRDAEIVQANRQIETAMAEVERPAAGQVVERLRKGGL